MLVMIHACQIPVVLPCIGIVLAGGRSARMGRDKALLPWQGRPLIERQIAVLGEAGADAIRVSGNRPGYGGIPDAIPGSGPLFGLASVGATCPDAHLLVIPVDMPLLSAALLQRLRAEARSAGCIRFAEHVLPMCLRWDARCRAILGELTRATDSHVRSLRALQQRTGFEELGLDADEAMQLIDCNSEEIWRKASGRRIRGENDL
ncbi:molybdenum cofactor guanylyltransferase [Burkholderiales bacterium GJ-E10]|nr:molybdenum cofactor guanylyltransferase [Burkholderiales bacterium GJ-E10]